MRINISLDKKSIKSAIEQVKAVQKKIKTELPKVYLQKCVAKIIEIANRNLAIVDIGSEAKTLIQTSWQISPVIGNKITLSNNAEFEQGKNIAVFVEFGVGVVGKGQNHTLASETNYQYNVPSYSKLWDKWYFTLEGGAERMNIESNYYESQNTKAGVMYGTKGSPATMFLYKAWKEFQTSGLYKTLWEEAKAEVIG